MGDCGGRVVEEWREKEGVKKRIIWGKEEESVKMRVNMRMNYEDPQYMYGYCMGM